MDSEELDIVDKSYIAAKAVKNASVDEKTNVIDCGIDVQKIRTLADYMGKDVEKGNKLLQTFVIPITLSNGEQLDLVVNSKGQDMACISKDGQKFKLTSGMEKEILNVVENKDSQKALLCPSTLEKFAKEIEEGTLIPKTPQDAVDKSKENCKTVGINTDSEEIEKDNDKDVEKEENEEEKQIDIDNDKKDEEKEDKEKDDEPKELPEEVRDEVARLSSENGAVLQEVMVVNPLVITQRLEDTGISENGGNVYCLRLRDGRVDKPSRVIMVQPGRRVVDDERYDKDMTDYMNQHRYKELDKSIEDEHDKIYYTDVHGNTTVSTISREPRDLNCTDKERLQKELEELNDEYKYVRNISKSQISLEDRSKAFSSIRDKMIKTFAKYGIQVPEVEREIRADQGIDDKMEEIGAQHRMKREENIQDDKKELPKDYEISEEDDGRDPREPNHNLYR